MRKLHLRRISPYPRHPLLWALVDLCGLTVAAVRDAALIPRSVLDRADLGYPLRPDHERRLHALLGRAVDELPLDAPPYKSSPPTVKRFRRALFDAVRQVLADFGRERPPQIRETALARDLADAVSTGARRELVLASLRRVHSPRQIRRALARYGYRDVERSGQRWLLPPTSALPREYPDSVPVRAGPRTPLQHRIQTAASIYLGRAPDGRASGRDVVEHVRSVTGASVPTIYKTVRQMVLVRESAGFGPRKVSTWSLPPAQPDDQAPPGDDEDDDPCGELGRVDGASARCGLPRGHDGGHEPS